MPRIDAFATEALQQLPALAIEAIRVAALPGLGDGPINRQLAEWLEGESVSELNFDCRDECVSGLWLAAGDINRSHNISQNIDTPSGSFLHGIMHRREGDFGNAKYWMRRVGEHPAIEHIRDQVGQRYTDPIRFVDRCGQSGSDENELQETQWVEWQCLMAHILGK